MTERRAHQGMRPARPHGDAPAAPRGPVPDAVERLPPGLAAQTPAPLLAALPERLGRYADLLCAWNDAVNLTGGRDRADVLARLVPDSFHLAAFLRGPALAAAADAAGPDGPRVWDLGAGGGLPGIPLRMVWERGTYTLVEVRQKRALFLANALAALQLARTRVFRGPAERLFAEQREGADWILSRAFLPWPKLLEFCRPALRPGGVVIIFAAAPCGELPAPWRPLAETAYTVGASRRWLWALQASSLAEAARGEGGHA